MATFWDEFKQHAEKFDEEIRSLELSYANPSGFFGTTTRHKSANKILNDELNVVEVLQNEVRNDYDGLSEMNNISESLLNATNELSEEISKITQMLEKLGFAFSVGQEATSDSEDLSDQLIEKLTVSDFPDENNSGNVIPCDAPPTKYVEQYLEDNNIELDDLVTPYIPRKSYLAKRSK